MSTNTPTPVSPTTRTSTPYVDHARALAPVLEGHSAEHDQQRRLAPAVVEGLHDGGIFSMAVPEALGGGEASPLEMLDVIDVLSYHDGASGWVALAGILASATAGAYLPEEGVRDLYPDGHRTLVEGHGSPAGRAEVVDGGFRLTGNWSYGSGIKHATHVHAGAMVFENGTVRTDPDGFPEMRLLIVPRDQVEFGDNWDVMGLRGTGSIDYSITDVFVPESHSYLGRTTTPERGGILYSLGVIGFGSVLHAGFALGAVRRVLDELAGFAVGRPDKTGSESFQETFARAEGRYRAGRALVHEVWTDVEASFARGETMTTRQESLIRLAANTVTFDGLEVVNTAYLAAGGMALRSGKLQQSFRDMHGATQHLMVSDLILRGVGRELLGAAPGQIWRHKDLVEVPGVVA